MASLTTRMTLHPDFQTLCGLAHEAHASCDALRELQADDPVAQAREERAALHKVRAWEDKFIEVSRAAQDDILDEREQGGEVGLPDRDFYRVVVETLTQATGLEEHDLPATTAIESPELLEKVQSALWAAGVPFAASENWRATFDAIREFWEVEDRGVEVA